MALALAHPAYAGAASLPTRMAYVGDSKQLIVVTAPRLGSRRGTLSFYAATRTGWKRVFSTPAKLGSRGLVNGRVRVKDTRTTPTGIWRIPDFVFGTHSRPPTGTKMAYRAITKYSNWSEEPNTRYNTWVESRVPLKGERLSGVRAYEYALSTGYNAAPNQQVVGRGTAIFLHVNHPGYTTGCVSVSRSAMRRIFRLLDPAKRPRFAIGTRRPRGATSIYAY